MIYQVVGYNHHLTPNFFCESTKNGILKSSTANIFSSQGFWGMVPSGRGENLRSGISDFQREESELTQQIEAAKTSLAAAVRRFEDSKSELGVQVIDVEAHAAMEGASMDAADGSAAGAALIDSLATMRSQLETVQASAEAMVTEEANNSNKRQRVEEGFVQSAPYSAPSATPQAMQPFAPRETTENQSPPFPSPDKK